MELHSSEGQFQKAIQQFSRLDDEWYQENTTRLFDEILTAITSNEGKESGAYTQPYELTKFVAAISGYDGNGSLYNPYAGSGSYCTELVGKGRYVAQEKMVSAWGVGLSAKMPSVSTQEAFIVNRGPKSGPNIFTNYRE